MISINLDSSNSYIAGIREIRAAFRAPAGRDEFQVVVTGPYGQGEVTLFLQASDLYVIGYFDLQGKRQSLVRESYTALGYADHHFPSIGIAQLDEAVHAVPKNDNTDKFKKGMTCLIVSIAEAARFDVIRNGFAEVLGGQLQSYTPDWNDIRHWDGTVPNP